MKWEIVCTGIGGRGVLLASAVLIETAISAGYRAMASDELGMSQRGGSVVSLVKVGTFRSPFVGRENADVILSFEESEFYRNLPFLKKGGLAIVNSRRSAVPPPVDAAAPREEGQVLPGQRRRDSRAGGIDTGIQYGHARLLFALRHRALFHREHSRRPGAESRAEALRDEQGGL